MQDRGGAAHSWFEWLHQLVTGEPRDREDLVQLLRDAERRDLFEAAGGYSYPESQTPWQEIQRSIVAQYDEGMVLEPAVKYQDIARRRGLPRHNH